MKPANSRRKAVPRSTVPVCSRGNAPEADQPEALRDSGSPYRMLFELNPCPMYIIDERTLAFLDVNEAALRLYGHSREAFLGLTVKDIRLPEDVPAVVATIRRQYRQRRDNLSPTGSPREGAPVFVGEWPYVKRDGSRFDAAVTVSFIHFAGRDARLVLVNDISARKNTEIALRDSQARYRTLFDQAADAILVFDPETLAILDFNDEACRHLGYSRKAFAKRKISDFELIESAAEIKRRVRSLTTERVEVFETKQRARNGAVLDIEVRTKALYMGGKRLIHGVWRDITARKQAEAALQHRLAAEHLLATVSTTLVNVSAANMDATVNEVLAAVGHLMVADRCYLFQVAADLSVAGNTHEWCASGIRAQICDLQNLPSATFQWMLARLRDGEPLSIPHVADIPPEAEAERQLMERGQVQSLMLVPIRHSGQLTGFIGCDAVRGERYWADTDVRLLRIVGELFAAAQIRCRTEEALLNAAREWRVTFDGVADAVFVLDAEQRILRSNTAAAALFGKSIKTMVGHHCWEIVHGTRQPIPDCPVTRMKRTRKRESMELAMGGHWFEVVVDPLIDPNGELRGAVHTVSDITARKQAEEALRNMAAELERRVSERTAALQESETRLTFALQSSHLGAWELDLLDLTAQRTPLHDRIFGYETLLPSWTYEMFLAHVLPEDRPTVDRRFRQAIATQSEWNFECRIRRADGEVRWIWAAGGHGGNPAAKPAKMSGIVQDITERKQGEVALIRTDRALRVVTHGDRALLRATGEQELLNEACRIAVEVGGYRMAWVGYAEPDARKSIRPMAQVGITKDSLSRLPLTWADTKFGRGPAGVAIRTGQPCVYRYVSRTPPFAPWKKEALERGCAAALALPLVVPQGCLGQLTICSAEPDQFDDAEIQLLQQLANDLSSGIMALRGRVEREELERQVLDISEREQRRLGQDLHDGVGQSVIAIGYLISAVQHTLVNKSAPEAAELERVKRLVWKTVDEVRDMARGLFPAELRNGGIADALRGLAQHTQDVYGMDCRFTGRTAITLADANMASQVYRIAQEAVNNAAKHSKSKKIRIGLSRRRGSTILTVRDAGVGLASTAGGASGMGQRIMKYRADMIGAMLNIASARGKGTTVICVLPPSRSLKEVTRESQHTIP